MPIHTRADTLGHVQALDSAARAACDAVDPFKLDIAIAAVFIAVAAVELAHLDPEGRNRAVTIVAAESPCRALRSGAATRWSAP